MPEAELERLAAELKRHDDLYYRAAAPELDDAGYDELRRRYDELADTLGVPATARYTRSVGDDHSEGFTTVTHDQPMLSLEKAATDPDAFTVAGEDVEPGRIDPTLLKRTAFGRLCAWQERVCCELERSDPPVLVVEPKIDGMSVALVYEDGRLARAVTRGDGLRGDLITAQVLAAGAVPERIGERARFEVRGELYLPRPAFAALNQRLQAAGERALINPRNGCAGLMKRKDPAGLAGAGVRSFLYVVRPGLHERPLPPSMWERLAWLRSLGFAVHPGVQRVRGVAEAYAHCLAWAGRRDGLDHDIDGMVLKLDDTTRHAQLGVTEHHPRWAIAYKFPPERRATVLKAVTVQVGRTGRLTPVAELEPVFLAGSTVARATLHNFAELAAKDVRAGDTVLVQKAGEIIPQVLEVVAERRPPGAVAVPWPETCPVCASAVVVERRRDPSGKENIGHFCPNPACPAQVRARLVHFAQREAMDIRGLGEAVGDRVVAALGVTRPDQLFALTAAQLAPLAMEPDERGVQRTFGAKHAANLVAALATARARGLAAVLFALGVHGLGSKLASDLAVRFRTWDALLAFAKAYLDGNAVARWSCRAFDGRDELSALVDAAGYGPAGDATMAALNTRFADKGHQPLEGVNRTTADTVFVQLAAPALMKVVDGLRSAGVALEHAGVAVQEVAGVAGRTFVLTGTLPTLTRDQAAALIEAAGGVVKDSVSKKTHFVVAGDEAGSKLTKAQALGVPVLDEAGLRALLAGPA
jgi:DNA ligase (NAD+)